MSLNNSVPESPEVILLCGISGSGKTHYAKELEKQGYRRLSADEIAWAQHGRNLVTMPLERQRAVYMQANMELLVQLERALADRRNTVVDSTLCSRQKRDVMRNLCRQFGVEPKLIFLQADKALLRRRLDARKGLDANDQPVSMARLECFCAGFQPPEPDEHPEVIPQK